MKTHLTVLQILHYVMAGLNLLWGGYLVAIAVFFLFVGAATGPGSGPGGPPFPIYLMGLFYLCPGILTLAVLVLNVMAGNNIAKARRRNLCIAAAIANLIPFLSCCYIVGIPLGVYGLVILFNAQTVQIFKHVERGVPFSEIN
ncbi:MAG TPA: hypothetical protein VL860_10240, partial [Planctomycetota bacterium]|nr:hypothetical protein [Planctomycetota bacterium]